MHIRFDQLNMTYSDGKKALKDINLALSSPSLVGLLGPNGAGKSTLMKILSGVYPHGSYEGRFYLEGEEKKFANIKESEDAGIQIIYQELALCKLMNVTENIYLGNEIRNKFGAIDWNESIKKTQFYLKEVNLDVEPLTPVVQLGIGQQQLVSW